MRQGKDGCPTCAFQIEMRLYYRRQALHALLRVSLERLGSAKLRLSAAALGGREGPCQDANRNGDIPTAAQGGPKSEVGAWGIGPSCAKVWRTTVRRSPP